MSLQEKLYQLYLLDKQVRGMRSRLDASIRRHIAQKRKFDRTNQQISELNDQLKHAQAKAGDLESQADTIEQKVKQIREQMNTVTTNKEYSALLIEVNTFKVEKSKLEDEALAVMTQIDELKEQAAELEQVAAEQSKDVAIAQKVVDQSRQEVGKELDKRTGERNAAAGEVPSDVLAMMERLADGYDGESMAELTIEGGRTKEYLCGGCHMGLPMERANLLMTNAEQPVTCPSCGRILYLGDRVESATKG